MHKPSKIKSNLNLSTIFCLFFELIVLSKAGCTFLLRRNGLAQYINGDQFLCFKKTDYFRVQEVATFFAKTAAERTPLGVRQSIEQEGNFICLKIYEVINYFQIQIKLDMSMLI